MIPEREKVPAGFYVHVPFCLRKCDYCDFYSVGGEAGLFDAYAEALEKEADEALAAFGPLTASTLYFGGGTPSALFPGQLERLFGVITSRFPLSQGCEITLEANPCSTDLEKVRSWKALNVNRVSLGVQSFHDGDLRFLNRPHTGHEAVRAITLLQDEGILNINGDLIFGIPGQTLRSFMENLETLAGFKVPHLSVYGLSIEENTPLFRRLKQGEFKKTGDRAYGSFFLSAHACLERRGFRHYEISNYAKPGMASRHNLDCWQGRDYLGFGPSAHTRFNLRRCANRPDIRHYIRSPLSRAFDLTLSREEARLERLMLGLRCDSGVEKAGLSQADRIEALLCRGLLAEEQDRVRLTEKGMLLLDEIILFLEGDKCLTLK
jgi:oxygen-independent coproporphyrinogen-3 oxidase